MKIHQHINAIYQIAYSLPEILVAILILVTAGIICLSRRTGINKTLSKITSIGLFVIFIVMLIYRSSNIQVYTRLFAYNYFAYQLKALLVGGSAIFAFFLSTKRMYKSVSDVTHTLLLGLVFSLMLITSANSLITIYVSLELYTITLCFLICSASNSEAKTSLRFIILSTIMSCVFLYGVSLYYSNMGSVSFYSVTGSKLNIVGTTGILFILSYFLFKLNAAPFHIWSIGVYKSTPIPIILFIDSIAKFIIFAVFCSFCAHLLLTGVIFFQKFLLIISIISMLIGGIVPFSQDNIKKFIAYSSIGHIGFALTVLTTFNNILELRYALTYLFSYVLSSICFFSGLICINKHINVLSFSDMKGAIKMYPIYAYSMICGLFSMAGLPPFIGFVVKIDIFNTMITHNQTYTYIIMFTYTLFAIAYTTRALKYMFMKGVIEEKLQTNFTANVFNVIATVILIISNIWFPYIDKQSSQVITSLSYYHEYVKSHESKTIELDLANDGIKQLYNKLRATNKKSSMFEKILDKLMVH